MEVGRMILITLTDFMLRSMYPSSTASDGTVFCLSSKLTPEICIFQLLHIFGTLVDVTQNLLSLHTHTHTHTHARARAHAQFLVFE
jgi:hypothetical protein